jgi:MOSC domain-containing protein YiiM
VTGQDQGVFEGELVGIFVAPAAGAAMEPRDEVEAIAGRGLVGDRYLDADGTYSGTRIADEQRAVTLIEQEAVAAARAEEQLELDASETRRNLVTSGVPLNHLVDEEFQVGAARLRGVKLAEPCAYLEGKTRPGVRAALIHRGGLRAEILDGGTLRLGDRITPLEA